MLTPEKQTELRKDAEKLGDQLYEHVKMHYVTAETPAERIDQQDFFQQEVVQVLFQRATASRVANALKLREYYTGE